MELDISKIGDISALKVIKSDQYDLLVVAQQQEQQATSAIQAISARIAELQSSHALSPNPGTTTELPGSSELKPVQIEVTTPSEDNSQDK